MIIILLFINWYQKKKKQTSKLLHHCIISQFFFKYHFLMKNLNNSTNKSLSTIKIDELNTSLSQDEFNMRIKITQWEIILFITFILILFQFWFFIMLSNLFQFYLKLLSKIKNHYFSIKKKFNLYFKTILFIFQFILLFSIQFKVSSI